MKISSKCDLKSSMVFQLDIAGPISLKSRLSHYELSQMILNIWDQFKLNYLAEKMSKGASTAQCGFSKYLLDGSQCRKRSKYFDEQKYQQVMLETFDVIESEDFQTVLENGIRDSLEHLLRSIEPHFQKNDLSMVILYFLTILSNN